MLRGTFPKVFLDVFFYFVLFNPGMVTPVAVAFVLNPVLSVYPDAREGGVPRPVSHSPIRRSNVICE